MRSGIDKNQRTTLEKMKRPMAQDIGKEYNIEGSVDQVIHKKYLDGGIFECSQCGQIITQPQYSSFTDAVNSNYKMIKPLECYKNQNGCGRRSSSTKFITLLPKCEYTSYEEIKLIPINQRYRPKFILEGKNVGVIEEGEKVYIKFILNAVPKKNNNFILRYFNIVKEFRILS